MFTVCDVQGATRTNARKPIARSLSFNKADAALQPPAEAEANTTQPPPYPAQAWGAQTVEGQRCDDGGRVCSCDVLVGKPGRWNEHFTLN